MNPGQQAFAGVLVHDVHDVHDPGRPAVVRAVVHEIVRPDVIPMGRPQSHARAIAQPQPPFLRLLLRNLELSASPAALHPRGVHLPAGVAQQGRDPAIPVAAVLPRQLHHVGHQLSLVLLPARHVPSRRAVLAEPPDRLPDPIDAPPPTRQAQSSPWPPPPGSACPASGQTARSKRRVRVPGVAVMVMGAA